MQRIWFDTEFQEFDAALANGHGVHVLDPISIGMVDDNGRTYSAVFRDFDKARAERSPWLKENVLPHLPPQSEWKSKDQIRGEVLEFIGGAQTEFRYWVAPQDPVILQALFAPIFLQQPRNLTLFPYNVAQKFNDVGAPRSKMPMKKAEHDALADAQWLKELDLALDRRGPA